MKVHYPKLYNMAHLLALNVLLLPNDLTIIIAPAYSRVRYRSPNFCPSVRSSVRQHLRRSLVFSTSMIAVSLKPCIVIVLDLPFKHAT